MLSASTLFKASCCCSPKIPVWTIKVNIFSKIPYMEKDVIWMNAIIYGIVMWCCNLALYAKGLSGNSKKHNNYAREVTH